MDTLLDRFCRYVRIDTQADEKAATYPSSSGQLELGRLLTQELLALGVRDAVQDKHGIVLGTVPATVSQAAPVIAWIAHVDTSPETGGQGEIDVETFSADLAIVTITGVNIHPAIAKGAMINAVRIAGQLIDRLPRLTLAPETTSDREGFLHPYRIEGGVAHATLRILL